MGDILQGILISLIPSEELSLPNYFKKSRFTCPIFQVLHIIQKIGRIRVIILQAIVTSGITDIPLRMHFTLA